MKKQRINANDLLPLIEETIHQGGSFELTVKGSSMRPFFTHNKTKVVLKKVSTLTPFNVYLFKHNDHVVLHRLIKIKDDHYYFKGDALKKTEMVKKQNIVAQVTDIKHETKTINIHSRHYRFRVKLWYHLRLFRRLLIKLLK